jgi:type IV fimbrial biogenesis protein FimT
MRYNLLNSLKHHRMVHPVTFRLARKNGVTLIELVITMTVVSILAMIAMPSYRQFVESGRLTTATNDFVADVSYARVEAMKRGPSQKTGVCASSDGTSCAAAPATWASGWIVFVDADANNAYNAAGGDTILKIHDALPSSLTATTNPAGTNTLIFDHIGSMPTSITSLQFNDIKVTQNRVICLNGGTGRAMVAANNNVSSCQ